MDSQAVKANGTAGSGTRPKQVILRWDTNETLFEGEYDTLREAIEAAVAQKQSLYRARLDGASLDGARLDGASLDGARLDGASLVGASLDGARLDGASLDGARLDGASLDGARLDGASLVGASLDGARLDGARLDGASLVGASLVGASLDGARLVGASLVGASLDTGETFENYCAEVVPALCVAGGRTLAEVGAAWDCHKWENCPMHVAFNGAKSENDERVPILLRPRVKQFVKFFDAQLLKRELIPGLGAACEACETEGGAA